MVWVGRARRSLSVTVEQVQAAIPKEAVLLEWLRYGHYLGKNQEEIRYGVNVPSQRALFVRRTEVDFFGQRGGD